MKQLSRSRLMAATLLAPLGVYFVGVFDKIVFSSDFYTTTYYRNQNNTLNISRMADYFAINTEDKLPIIYLGCWLVGIPVTLALYKFGMLNFRNVVFAALSCAAAPVLGLILLSGDLTGEAWLGSLGLLALAAAGAFLSAAIFCLVGGVGRAANAKAAGLLSTTGQSPQ